MSKEAAYSTKVENVCLKLLITQKVDHKWPSNTISFLFDQNMTPSLPC